MSLGVEAKESWQKYPNTSGKQFIQRESQQEESFSIGFLIKIEVSKSWYKIVSPLRSQLALISELITISRTESQFLSLNSVYAEAMHKNWGNIFKWNYGVIQDLLYTQSLASLCWRGEGFHLEPHSLTSPWASTLTQEQVLVGSWLFLSR